MTGIINILYLVLFLGISAVGLYVCYHILRYSSSRKNALITALIFASVFLFLLSTNTIAFFRVDWGGLFRNAGSPSLFPSSYSRF